MLDPVLRPARREPRQEVEIHHRVRHPTCIQDVCHLDGDRALARAERPGDDDRLGGSVSRHVSHSSGTRLADLRSARGDVRRVLGWVVNEGVRWSLQVFESGQERPQEAIEGIPLRLGERAEKSLLVRHVDADGSVDRRFAPAG